MARDEFANLPGKEQLLARMIGREVGAVLIGAQRADERVASAIAGACVVCHMPAVLPLAERLDGHAGPHHPVCPHAVAS